MAEDCCYIVGGYPITGELSDKCIVSVNVNTSTDTSKCGDCLIIGPTVGTISISGYVKDSIHAACSGKAGVQIPWVRKYDCESNVVHFLFSGEGKAFTAGDIENLAEVNLASDIQILMNASSSSGPGATYSRMEQTNGYGMVYTGGPIGFDTSEKSTLMFDGTSVGVPYSECYMQSFSLDMNSGQVPTASYSFVFFVSPEE